ncbi:MAG: hypothetical protein IT440_15605 [Phycisphaeraceae bacterium]|nr:hypothetical protein [Phycisphaeraceae bacterium]
MKKILLILVLCSTSALAQIANHHYPRIGAFQFGSGTPWWHARFDLINTGQTSTGFAAAVKALNPDCIILPTRDWNAGPFSYGYDIPNEWKTKHADGSFISLYTESDFYMDLTDYCPLGTTTSFAGLRYNEALAAWHVGLVNMSYYDGLATDGLWNSPNSANNDIDLDRNGLNDYNEGGKGGSWVDDQIESGLNEILARARALIGSNKVILVNSGGMHTYGWTNTNGMLKEHSVFFYSLGDVTYNVDTYLDFIATAPTPHVMLIDGEDNVNMPNHVEGRPEKNYAQMRFWLGFTLMGDGYFSFSPDEQHMYTLWYDEFNLDLGYPKNAANKFRTGAGGEGGLYARFFDRGVVIFNGTGTNQTVSDANLQALSGYAGPYYHFRGGQDPTVNNGQQFSSESVAGATATIAGNVGSVYGTSLILLTEPDTVIADVIVDNWRHGTSPGSDSARFYGTWTGLPRDGDESGGDYYSLRDRFFEDPGDPATLYGYAYTAAGSGADSVVFRPTFGLSGYYRVYEWHGWLGASESAVTEGTNVPYKIYYNGGTETVTVNQSTNFGAWNYLGRYAFAAGSSNNIRVSDAANGSVMADAVRFVYDGASSTPDVTPPAAPQGFRVTQ